MRSPSLMLLLPAFLALAQWCPAAQSSAPSSFTRLEQLPAPKIIASSEAYPGGHYQARNLVDGKAQTEYSSNGKGTGTFVEFDFGAPQPIAAFRHLDRNDPATVASSELRFLDATGAAITNLPVTHVNRRAGTTWLKFSAPITAQRVRWQVTALGAGLSTVGGAEIAFFTLGSSDPAPKAIRLEAQPLELLERKGATLVQPLKITVDYPYAEPTQGVLVPEGGGPQMLNLSFGTRTLECLVPPVQSPRKVTLTLTAGPTAALIRQESLLRPVRKMTIYLLPHSHNDIGYTALQADVVQKQNSNIETGLRLAKATADYPEGARFKWNVEVLWCVDNYLRAASPDKRVAFIEAVKKGQIGLDAFYCNILTGLCRPEELLNLMRYATQLSELCGVKVDSAMISDVPGYTWSTVSAMAQAGVKYFSFAPNYFDRMGGTMKEWQNRPFWWRGPDGQSRVLCWCPSRGYALGHIIGDGEALARFIPDYLVELQTNAYPYDITHLRWNVHGDNGSPDEKLADVVRQWNERYAYPRLVISTTSEAFREFERRYGNDLPQFSGDYTPYWEDGAASSARETALNRASAERLSQAEALWVMRNPQPFPAERFQEAWRNVLLYSEHTWGAHNSISQPDLPFVRDQWKVKQGFALDADKESRALLAEAETRRAEAVAGEIEVFNTSSWTRTDLVALPPELSSAGDVVADERGKTLASQRLSTGELVFVARQVPPFSSRRFRVQSGACPASNRLQAEGATLSSPDFTVVINEQTGGIKSLFSRALKQELVDPKAETALNDYFYLPGSNLKNLQRNPIPNIKVKEKGPVLVSLLIESAAPGCRRLAREVRLIDGLDRVEIINLIDKQPIRSKEGLHFGYGFNVPDGTVRMDVGLAMVRPELDQIPAACKNWFSVQRWVDISNDKFGVTWAPIDAPLVELGGITANLVGSQTDWRVWIQHLQPSQTLYSWVMNNHWHTNYRADQEGPTVFRFYLRPHKGFAAEEAAQFGTACSQPLIPAPASAKTPRNPVPRLRVSSDDVVVESLKPTDDGKGWLVRLFGASGKAETVKLAWSTPAPHRLWLSDTSEQPKQPLQIGSRIPVPAWGIVTLRAEAAEP